MTGDSGRRAAPARGLAEGHRQPGDALPHASVTQMIRSRRLLAASEASFSAAC